MTSERVTDEMINAGGSAIVKSAHLTGCERAKLVYEAMRPLDPAIKLAAVEGGLIERLRTYAKGNMKTRWTGGKLMLEAADAIEVASIREADVGRLRNVAPMFGGSVDECAAALIEWDRKGGWATNADIRAAIRTVARAALSDTQGV